MVYKRVRITIVTVFVLAAFLYGVGLSGLARVNADGGITNADYFTAVTGGSITVSNDNQPTIGLTPANTDGTVSFEYTEPISATDYMKDNISIVDWTFNTAFNARKFTAMSITMEDAADPSQQLVVAVAGNESGAFNSSAGVKVGFSDNASTVAYGGIQDGEGRYYLGRYEQYTSTTGCYMGNDSRYYFSYDNFDPSTAWDGGGGRTVNVNSTTNSVANLNYLDADHGKEDMIKNYFKNADAEGPIPELFTSGYFKLRFKFYGVRDNTTAFTLNAVAGQNLAANGLKDRTPPDGEILLSAVNAVKDEDDIEQILANSVIFSDRSGIASVECEIFNQSGGEITFVQASQAPDTYNAKVYATDGEGNASKRFAITVHVVDGFEIPSDFSVNIGFDATYFPALSDLPDGYSCYTYLLNAGATGTEGALTNETSYAFGDTGEYRILYRVYNVSLQYADYYCGLSVADTSPPLMTFGESYRDSYSIGETVEILVPALSDNNPSGNPVCEVKVYFGSNEEQVVNGAVRLSKTGIYTVVYTARDKSGNVSVEKFYIGNGGTDAIKPTVVLTERYQSSYTRGQKIRILAATVTDNSDEVIVPSVEAYINGNEKTITDNVFTADEEGVCIIKYTAVDVAGNRTVLRVDIRITKKEPNKTAIILGSVFGGLGLAGAGTGAYFIIKKRRRHCEK